jgi:hypothetical protein
MSAMKRSMHCKWMIGAAMAVLTSASALAADIAVKAPGFVAVPDVNSMVIWAGSDFKNRVSAGNIGGIYALNGNLDASGWLIRGQATYVDYNFATALAPSGTGNGKFTQGSAAVGYQFAGSNFVASALIGIDGQNYDITPGAARPANISNTAGVAVYGRLATKGGALFPSAIEANFSSANNAYWVRGRTGVRFGQFVVGPELIGLGNKAYDEVRAGGYVTYDITSKWIVQANLGYAAPQRGQGTGAARGGNGAYGGVTLVFLH